MAKSSKRKRTLKVFTVSTASEEVGLKPNQVLYAIRKGIISPAKEGWVWVLSEEDVEKLKEYKQNKK